MGYKNIEKNKQLLYNYVLDLPRIPVTNQDFVGILDPEKTFTFTTMAEAPHCWENPLQHLGQLEAKRYRIFGEIHG